MTGEAPEATDTDDVTRLVGRFLAAVSFAKGQAPDYTSLPALTKNSGEEPELTIDALIEPRQPVGESRERTQRAAGTLAS